MTVIGASGGSGFFLIIIVAFLLLWLIVVRPQRKRQSQQQQMLNELHVGTEVLTAGGIYGTVTKLDEDEVTVEIAPQLEVRVARRAIAGVIQQPEPEEPEEEEGEEGESDEPEASEEAESTAASPETAHDSIGATPSGEAPVEEDRG